jgi:hypothetical protein
LQTDKSLIFNVLRAGYPYCLFGVTGKALCIVVFGCKCCAVFIFNQQMISNLRDGGAMFG